ncbi:RloB family protein [Candidatus Poriferisodalis sp.]|uniref:RloB family protein n=1 Tax=Candidatus Poriferisodalis sp. TaxID=3101277 RepID=UPI003B5A0B33
MSSGRNRARHAAPRRKTQRIIRVHSEGEKTEPKYLGRWGKIRGPGLTISWGITGAAPMTLVEKARNDIRAMKQVRRRNEVPFDEVWCVFDRDAHANVSQALNEARQSGIHVAFSDPCFELWLVLHAQEHTAPLDRITANRLARELGLIDKKNKKDVPAAAWQVLEPGYADAKARAQTLAKRHETAGSSPRSNPSSDVWRLVDVLST